MRRAAAEAVVIGVSIACDKWQRACPEAESITAAAAHAALDPCIGLSVATPLLLDITLTDDAEQRGLNRTYRGKDMPTNVLAFPLGEATPVPAGAPVLLGDVVLAFETVAREAAEQGKTLADHLRHLVVHGVLHLLGFDHETDAEAAIMEARETEILRALGVPDPYRDTI